MAQACKSSLKSLKSNRALSYLRTELEKVTRNIKFRHFKRALKRSSKPKLQRPVTPAYYGSPEPEPYYDYTPTSPAYAPTSLAREYDAKAQEELEGYPPTPAYCPSEVPEFLPRTGLGNHPASDEEEPEDQVLLIEPPRYEEENLPEPLIEPQPEPEFLVPRPLTPEPLPLPAREPEFKVVVHLVPFVDLTLEDD